jgi:putative membrane protein
MHLIQSIIPKMISEESAEPTHVALTSNDLAFERTMLSYERTLMAWVRTAISLISFGFTIYKFFQELAKANDTTHKLFTPRIVGMTMISFGLLCLLLAQIQHKIAIKRLAKDYPKAQKSLTSVLSILILLFGLALFLGALFRQ